MSLFLEVSRPALCRDRAAVSFVLLVAMLLPAAGSSQSPGDTTREEARGWTAPRATEDSIVQGRKHYLRLCQNCHGKDGRALDNFDFEATDLTDPKRYLHGTTDGEIFLSIQAGAGYDMPAFSSQLNDEQVWQVVHFLRSLGPEEHRPDVEPADPPSSH